jgi:phosphoadenosine phosphosulfate reductase
MYAYTHDPETGGLLLNDSTPMVSKEPRPVYYKELDILGFDKHWNYEKQDNYPYLWAEANVYWYRGRQVAKTKGGSLYTAPAFEFLTDEAGKQILPDGETLIPVDIEKMVEKNRELVDIIEQITVKKIFDVYKRYKNKLDCFHVAFSGGKDSIVLLNLVKKALPKSGFVVVFGDTGMEFPDTYDTVDKVEAQCKRDGVEFYRAASHLKPEESWRLFGPPSRVLRWCCSVHKSAPQTLKLREVTGKPDYSGMAYVGVRAYESATRSEYEYENFGKKQKGQHSFHAILDWSSAEVWLYTFSEKLTINKSYKYGNSRAGCILCPMSVTKSDYIKRQVYRNDIDKYTDIITSLSGRNFSSESYIESGGWVSRRSGRDLKNNKKKYFETKNDTYTEIKITSPTTSWREWYKTLEGLYEIPFVVKKEDSSEVIITLSNEFQVKNPIVGNRFKQVMRKSAYCLKCGACQSNCSNGKLSFDKDLNIVNCDHCLKCHEIDDGCIAYASLKIPTEEKSMSINCFDSVIPKSAWFEPFFRLGDEYWEQVGLGPNQIKIYKRFLKDSGLTNKMKVTPLFNILKRINPTSEISWGIILTNLAFNNPQFNWYIKNFEIGQQYSRDVVLDLLSVDLKSENARKFVFSAFKGLMELPFGELLNFGYVDSKGNIIRTKSTLSDPRVVLYSLYKFAEACEGYYQFSLSRLLDHTIESKGISPTQIFGFDRDDMERFLNGLSANYPEFINATFTHDLDKIALRSDKTSEDVLTLF